MFASVIYKLPGTRKVREFVLQEQDEGQIIMQGDGLIVRFNPDTGQGVINKRGSTFLHLSPVLGAQAFEAPADLIEQCRTALDEWAARADGDGYVHTQIGGVTILAARHVTTVRPTPPPPGNRSRPSTLAG